MNIKLYVVAHKPYPMPTDDIYVPMGVGAARQTYEVSDATGDNIAKKNPHYCELTGLYWIWKNADADYLGLVHYRRHFTAGLKSSDKWKRVATRRRLERALNKADIVLPSQRHYVIETSWSQYAHAHHEADLIKTREIIGELCPEYLPCFDAVMKRTHGHRFNMLVMKKEALDAYCSWLFPILFRLEERLDISDYSSNDARVFGFVGERLLDVWLEKNKPEYTEMPVVNMESQHWGRKIYGFLKRKYTKG